MNEKERNIEKESSIQNDKEKNEHKREKNKHKREKNEWTKQMRKDRRSDWEWHWIGSQIAKQQKSEKKWFVIFFFSTFFSFIKIKEIFFGENWWEIISQANLSNQKKHSLIIIIITHSSIFIQEWFQKKKLTIINRHFVFK